MVYNFSYLFYKNDLIFLFPEIFLVFSVLFYILFFLTYGEGLTYNKPYLLSLGSKLFLFVIFICSIIIYENMLFDVVFINFSFISNYFTNVCKIILLFSLFFCILISLNYYKNEKFNDYEYIILLFCGVIGISLLISTNDLITFYLSLELQSLSFYTLASLKRSSKLSTESGLKYFVLGSFSSALILYGFSFLYGFTGFINFNDYIFLDLSYIIKEDFYIFSGILLGLILTISGLFFKMGLAPFHSWVADVYEGAPSIVTLVFTILPKIGVFAIFIRLMYEVFFSLFPFWNYIIILFALLSIVIGSFSAIFQIKFKRMLAFSGLTHLSFMILAISFGNIAGLFSFFIYFIIYIIISLNLFSLFIFLRRKNSNLKLKKIYELKNLFKNNKVLALLFLLPLFSIAGIPPLLGFFSKAIFFFCAIKENYIFLSIFFFTMSVISSFFYIRIIKIIFFSEKKEWIFLKEFTLLESYLISFLSLSNLLFCFYPSIIIDFSFSLATNFILML